MPHSGHISRIWGHFQGQIHPLPVMPKCSSRQSVEPSSVRRSENSTGETREKVDQAVMEFGYSPVTDLLRSLICFRGCGGADRRARGIEKSSDIIQGHVTSTARGPLRDTFRRQRLGLDKFLPEPVTGPVQVQGGRDWREGLHRRFDPVLKRLLTYISRVL
jgi:hypothetical protein